MKTRKAGNRHTLLLYKRVMDRLWSSTLVLGLILLGLWGWGWFSPTILVEAQNSIWLLAGACTILAFSFFAFFGRTMAYVQPYQNHLRLVTPFLRTNISYRRIRSVHPVDFKTLSPPSDATWAQRRLLDPFFGRTAVIVELNSYPVHPVILRFFLAPQMFSRKTKGLVLLVPDWMAFSTELDTYRTVTNEPMMRRRAQPGWVR